MSGYPHHLRLMSYVSISTFLILTLLTADNVFWEGVRLASYLCVFLVY